MMNKEMEFNDILDQCLEQILVNGQTVEQCLDMFPKQAAELEPLLQTASLTIEAASIEPNPEFRRRARYAFQQEVRALGEKKAHRLLGWVPQWATVTAVALFVLVTGGGGMVAASANSMPDEPLYEVKLMTEQVRLALTPSSLGKAELHVELADRRVAEILEMAKEGKGEKVEQTADKLNEHLVALAGIVATPVPGSEPAMLQAPAPVLAPMAPPQVQTGTSEPEVVMKAAEPEPEITMAQVPEEDPLMAPASPEPLARAEVQPEPDKEDKYSEVRSALARSAMENPQSLHEVLDSVPDEAKPALQRAIELSRRGYQQALDALSR